MNRHSSTLTTFFICIFPIMVVLPSLFSHQQPIIVSATSRFLTEIHPTGEPPINFPIPAPLASPPPYEILCNKTTWATLCLSAVKADRRESLKSSAAGLVVILVDAAKRDMKKTTKFIEKNLNNSTLTDEVTRTGLKNCKFGYGTVGGNDLYITVDQLRDADADRREEFSQVLQNTDDEVSYDCEWFQPEPFPDLLRRMFSRVNAFSHMLQNTRNMLNLIS